MVSVNPGVSVNDGMNDGGVSLKRVEANRLNAQKSTGPKTPQGKAVSSRNAMRHGVFSSQLRLEEHEQAEFEMLRDGLVEDLRPAGGYEGVLVDRIIVAAWKLRRLESAEEIVLEEWTLSKRESLPNRKSHCAAGFVMNNGAENFDRFARLRQLLERSMDKARQMLREWRQNKRKELEEQEDEQIHQNEAKVVRQEPEPQNPVSALPVLQERATDAQDRRDSAQEAIVRNEASEEVSHGLVARATGLANSVIPQNEANARKKDEGGRMKEEKSGARSQNPEEEAVMLSSSGS